MTDEWLAQKGERARFIMTQDELNTVDPAETDYLFGLFSANHMPYDHHRKEGRDPSISEMTEKAIQVLKLKLF